MSKDLIKEAKEALDGAVKAIEKLPSNATQTHIRSVMFKITDAIAATQVMLGVPAIEPETGKAEVTTKIEETVVSVAPPVAELVIAEPPPFVKPAPLDIVDDRKPEPPPQMKRGWGRK